MRLLSMCDIRTTILMGDIMARWQQPPHYAAEKARLRIDKRSRRSATAELTGFGADFPLRHGRACPGHPRAA